MKRRRLFLIILAGLLALLLIGVSGFVIWASATPDPMPFAMESLTSDGEVAVFEEGGWIRFEPLGEPTDCGLVLYPGGRVDHRSYAPLARELARNGIHTVLVPMPLNLAFFAPGKAAEVIDYYPDIQTWVIGGHSLGGSMATSFSASNPDQVNGLVLLASYSTSDLSNENIEAVTIYGTADGLITVSEIQESLTLLPDDVRQIAIEGGNHAQFGWYGDQAGDLPATISRQEQQDLVLSGTLELFNQIGCTHLP